MPVLDNVFITGIGGFIGARAAELLRERGVRVWGIDHDPTALERARARGIQAELGDVNDAVRLGEQLRGAEVVLHTAAIVREHGALAEFRRVNVEGSATVAAAARDAGALTFVQLSSVMVYGFRYPADVAEDGPLRGEGNPYCQTKIESERAVLSCQDGERFGVIVIRPGDVYGPGSVPWIARPIEMLSKRRLLLPWQRGVINPVYVDDLIEGILLAVNARAHGETFNVTDGAALPFRSYFGRLAQLAGLPGPIVIPTPLMRALARGMSKLRELGLSDDEVSPDTVETLLRPHAYSIAKARRLLGYAPRVTLEQGLAQTYPFIEQCVRRARSRSDRA